MAVHRSFTVPLIDNPRLLFDYTMYSYDIIASSTYPYDTFEVAINNPSPNVWETGNPTSDGAGCLNNVWVSDPILPTTVSIDLTGYSGQDIDIFFVLHNKTDDKCNSWVYVDNIRLEPEMIISKTNDPPGPVHEGDIITYTIAYANTSLATHVLTITDVLPFNTTYVPDTIQPAGIGQFSQEDSTIVWQLGEVSPGGAGEVSFQVRVDLLPPSPEESAGVVSLVSSLPAYFLPQAVTCDTTRFWAHGVTPQLTETDPYEFEIQIPPGTTPAQMWLLMKGTNNGSPLVGGAPAKPEQTVHESFGATLWSAPITPTEIAGREVVTVTTNNARNLNAIFLFDEDDPPFGQEYLADFYNNTDNPYTKTYALEIPSVTSQTIDVILPLLDITDLNYDEPPDVDARVTTVTVEFNGQEETAVVNRPNMGNGLVMPQFSFEIGELDTETATKMLTVTIATKDSVYTLGPRVCRPVYIENTAWLCSDKAGCISDTVANIPDNFRLRGGIYLPIIMKSSP